MTRTYLVVYEKGLRNWGGFAPDVAGCGSLGDTLKEIRANLKEGLEFHLAGNAEDGILPPEAITAMVDFSDETRANGVEYCVVEWLEVRLPALATNAARQPALTSATQDQGHHG